MKGSIIGALSLCLALIVSSVATPAEDTSAKTSTQAKATSKKQSSSRSYRYGQRSPSRERMKQIQLALKEHGYSPGPIDGAWGSKSSSALKRFEKDHDLPADGRLDSLALITLGLGPKPLANTASANPLPTSGK